MEVSLRDIVAIATSLVLFSVLFAFLVYLSQAGTSLLAIGEERRSFQGELQAERELSQYNNTKVTKDDIFIAVQKYKQELTITIEYMDSFNVKKKITLSEKANEATWDVNSFKKMLGQDASTVYIANLTKNEMGQRFIDFKLQ